MSIVNPSGFVYLDIIYYLVILTMGPGTAFYLFFFRAKRRRLIDAYWETGVQVMGIVTQRKVTITRGALTGIEKSRKHEIRYAYKPPGSDRVYVKDFVQVTKDNFHRRVLSVLVLPGQPESGVAKFKVPKPGCLGSAPSLCGCWALSLVFLVYCSVVFAFAIAFYLQRGTHCVETKSSSYGENEYACFASIGDYAAGFFVSIVVGGMIAVCHHESEEGTLPGRVYKRHYCPDRHPSAQIPVAMATNLNEDSTDNRTSVPMAEAMAILNSEEAENAVEVHASVVQPTTPANPSEKPPDVELANLSVNA